MSADRPTWCPRCGWEGATLGPVGWECARCQLPVRTSMNWRPIATTPRDRDVLLWVPPSAVLADLTQGHIEVGRAGWDGRATHWMPLPEPPRD